MVVEEERVIAKRRHAQADLIGTKPNLGSCQTNVKIKRNALKQLVEKKNAWTVPEQGRTNTAAQEICVDCFHVQYCE
jgi:hypothetical protein